MFQVLGTTNRCNKPAKGARRTTGSKKQLQWRQGFHSSYPSLPVNRPPYYSNRNGGGCEHKLWEEKPLPDAPRLGTVRKGRLPSTVPDNANGDGGSVS